MFVLGLVCSVFPLFMFSLVSFLFCFVRCFWFLVMKTTLAIFCSASLPTPRFADPSPPLWGSVKSPVMGLPAFPVPDAGFGVELLLLSLFLLSMPVLGRLSFKMVVYASLMQLSVQGVHSVKSNAVASKNYRDSHTSRTTCCFSQSQLTSERGVSEMCYCWSDWSSFSLSLAFVVSVYVVVCTVTCCRCRMTNFV